MKKSMLVPFVLLILAACGGSNWQSRRLSMLPSSSAQADSLTAHIQQCLRRGISEDSLTALVDSLRAMSRDSMEQLKCDYLLALRHREAPREVLEDLLSKADSAASPYLYACIMYEARKDLSLFTPEQEYAINRANIKYFASIGDTLMLAYSYNGMGLCYFRARMFEKALDQTAESHRLLSLYSKGDVRRELSLTSINEVSILLEEERIAEADSVLTFIEQDAMRDNNSRVLHSILTSRYIIDNERYEAMHAALDLSMSDSSLAETRGLDAMILSSYWLDRERFDSARVYADIALANYYNGPDPRFHAYIDRGYASLLEAEGKLDSAIFYMKRGRAIEDSINVARSAAEISAYDLRGAIDRYEAEMSERSYRERARIIYIALGFLIVCGAGAFLFYRHNQRMRLAQAEADLELERSRRYMAAKALAMEEKDRLLDETRQRVGALREQGRIEAETASEIDSLIRFHKAGSMEWETFYTLMEKVSPKFTGALKRLHPDLPEPSLKMAMYIYVGMSNHQIAQMLLIRPESVRQKRWRLAKRLNVPDGTTLDDYLRSLDS